MDAVISDITRRTRRYILEELGFDLVGFAAVGNMNEEMEHYREWLLRGYQGSMTWMERNVEKREDVRAILPEARSVIVVARNYYTPEQHADDPRYAKISRYAWGRDYHKILPKKLQSLDKFLRTLHPDAQSRWYVDTGPVLEKPWAVRAGLGWMGKHTNLITRSHGSWVFLGVLISSLEFHYDDPVSDLCGDCTACIDACPTQAITEPYVLDATRCISYITIEQKPKEEIPQKLGSVFDGWVFGCDICQDVCPWNRFQQQTDEPSFAPRDGVLDLTLEQVVEMSDEEFRNRFSGTPVMRTKAGGLRRNARGVLP